MSVPAPCVVVTVYDDLRGDRALPLVDRLAAVAAPGDLAVCVHDPPSRDDAGLARAITGRGLRLWQAWGVDPDARGDLAAAVERTRERCALAVSRGAEVVELNGEAAWKRDDGAVDSAHPLHQRALALIAAAREGAPGVPLSWTSFDHVAWHRLPWGAILGTGGVDLHAPQHYAASAPPAGHRQALERLEGRARGQLASLVRRGLCRPALAAGGDGWTPYGQVYGLTTAGAAVVLDAAAITRAWAIPTRCDPAGLDAIEGVLRARRLTGRAAGAVRRAQATLGLAVDGALGPRTLAALRASR